MKMNIPLILIPLQKYINIPEYKNKLTIFYVKKLHIGMKSCKNIH